MADEIESMAGDPWAKLDTRWSRPSVRSFGGRVAAVVLAAIALAPLAAVVATMNENRAVLVPSVAEANQELATAQKALADNEQRLAELRLDAVQLETDRASLNVQQQQTLDLLEQAARNAREYMLSAFVAGGDPGAPATLLDVTSASEVSWRWYLVSDRAQLSRRALARYEALRASADRDLLAMADRAESVEVGIRAAESDRPKLRTAVADAEQRLVIASAWAESDEAVANGRYGEAPIEAWNRLRFCESSDDYRAISPTGKYRGAYQFDLPTWQTVGGTGDPIDAPPLEQDARARTLYALRGRTTTWPECGRYLPG
ncbi:MAG: hypothetical protein HKN26_17340 [Acidimicrobiales bacterium]|nr:hypothetical protein [Acidimicrobiales bacterium]